MSLEARWSVAGVKMSDSSEGILLPLWIMGMKSPLADSIPNENGRQALDTAGITAEPFTFDLILNDGEFALSEGRSSYCPNMRRKVLWRGENEH